MISLLIYYEASDGGPLESRVFPVVNYISYFAFYFGFLLLRFLHTYVSSLEFHSSSENYNLPANQRQVAGGTCTADIIAFWGTEVHFYLEVCFKFLIVTI